MKIDPILNIVYKTEYAKKHFEKKGYDPTIVLRDTFTNPHYGVSTWYSYILLNCAFAPPGLLLVFLYIEIFGKPNSPIPAILIWWGYGAIIFIISQIYLLRKDKYIKYIRLYDKQPRAWKIKWAWISAGILMIPLIITIIGMNLLP
jgi:hypothetical protein